MGFELLGRILKVYRGKNNLLVLALHNPLLHGSSLNNDVTGNYLQGNPRHVTHISQSEKGLHMEEFLRMQTFLRLAYMYYVLRIPLKEVPCDVISSSQQYQILQMFTININLPVSCKTIAKQTGLGILELLHCNIYIIVYLRIITCLEFKW